MDFPVADLLGDELSEQWLLKHFHPKGLKCPHCDARRSQARPFRRTRRSQVMVYRCHRCHGLYNVYSGTIFQARHLRPAQVVLLLRGVCKGEPTAGLARELSLPRSTVHVLRQRLQENARAMRPDTPLPDAEAETDEMFQNAGAKRRKTRQPRRPATPPG
jgi:transposase-like protein